MDARQHRAKLDHLSDMHVDVVVELGRKRLSVDQIANLRSGSVLALDKLAGEAFNVRVNGAPFAEGEVVVVTDIMGCRLTRLAELDENIGDQP